MRKSFITLTIAATLLAIAAGCSPRTANRGNFPAASQLEKLEVGKHSKDYVRGVLGTPSTVGTFDKNVWYYIGRRTERWAFFEESVLEQQIVAIYFDPANKIEHIQTYDEADSRDIAIVEDKTPTAGRELGVVEQIIGNLGRFNRPASSGSRY
jgi:outer membrane protein assembly factor BamE (lipoprotein component of BamABCDE complex)